MANSNSPFSGSPIGVSAFERSPSNPTVPLAPAPQATTKPKSKPRKRVNTAEKRHQHNAIERQRRETLNGKFLGLARLLPSLASHRRPSKSAIVNGSIAHLTHQRDQRLLAARLLRQLCAERDALAKECNEWRVANNFQPKDLASAWTDEMEQVCDVEKEVFGTFATMQEDGDDDDQESNNVEMALEQAAFVASSIPSSNGLITPRSSTDIDAVAHALSLKPQQQQQQQAIHSNWAADFSFNPTNGSLSNSTASLPFSAFMSDGLESLCDSPTNSQQTNGGIPTPPTSADFAGFSHTPSPRSTNSFEDVVTVNNPWTEQQMLFLQSVQQQQLQQRQSSISSQPPQQVHQLSNTNQGLNPLLFNNSFNHGHANGAAAGYTDSNAFTQSLIASMFPQQSNVHIGNNNPNVVLPQQPPHPQHPNLSRAQTENMEAWRKLAIGGMIPRGNDTQPSVAELKNAIRTGMGIGMNLGNGMWEQSTVKGF